MADWWEVGGGRNKPRVPTEKPNKEDASKPLKTADLGKKPEELLRKDWVSNIRLGVGAASKAKRPGLVADAFDMSFSFDTGKGVYTLRGASNYCVDNRPAVSAPTAGVPNTVEYVGTRLAGLAWWRENDFEQRMAFRVDGPRDAAAAASGGKGKSGSRRDGGKKRSSRDTREKEDNATTTATETTDDNADPPSLLDEQEGGDGGGDGATGGSKNKQQGLKSFARFATAQGNNQDGGAGGGGGGGKGKKGEAGAAPAAGDAGVVTADDPLIVIPGKIVQPRRKEKLVRETLELQQVTKIGPANVALFAAYEMQGSRRELSELNGRGLELPLDVPNTIRLSTDYFQLANRLSTSAQLTFSPYLGKSQVTVDTTAAVPLTRLTTHPLASQVKMLVGTAATVQLNGLPTRPTMPRFDVRASATWRDSVAVVTQVGKTTSFVAITAPVYPNIDVAFGLFYEPVTSKSKEGGGAGGGKKDKAAGKEKKPRRDKAEAPAEGGDTPGAGVGGGAGAPASDAPASEGERRPRGKREPRAEGEERPRRRDGEDRPRRRDGEGADRTPRRNKAPAAPSPATVGSPNLPPPADEIVVAGPSGAGVTETPPVPDAAPIVVGGGVDGETAVTGEGEGDVADVGEPAADGKPRGETPGRGRRDNKNGDFGPREPKPMRVVAELAASYAFNKETSLRVKVDSLAKTGCSLAGKVGNVKVTASAMYDWKKPGFATYGLTLNYAFL